MGPTAISLISVSLVVLIVSFAVYFRINQNRNTEKGTWVGGEISWPKAFWLAYALGSWFFIPALFIFNPLVPDLFRNLIIVHTLVWWIRGVLELVMIYRWMNWTPIYGISHDIVHAILLATGLAFVSAKSGWAAISTSLPCLLAMGYILITLFALMAEMTFAALFLTTRGKEASKIYFASDSPEFRLINRLTTVVCVVVYAHLFAQTVLLFFVN